MEREKAIKNFSDEKLASGNDDAILEMERRFRTSLEMNTKFKSSNLEKLVEIIPANWTVLELSIDLDKDVLFAVRISNGKVYSLCLPLNRAEFLSTNQHFKAKRWFDRLNHLLLRSRESTRYIDSLLTKQKKMEWWNDRNALDNEMKTLVWEIENTWLGAFKVSLSAFL